jgi:hypothetical protein
LIAIVGLALVVALGQPAGAEIVVWNDHWYEAVYWGSRNDGLSWSLARDEAISRGGYLATVTSAAENDFVFSLVSDNEDFWFQHGGGMYGPWIGASQTEQGWEWVTGEPWDYTSWHDGSPDTNPSHDCVHYLHAAGDPRPNWDDWYGNFSYYWPRGYIVEGQVPEPTGVVALVSMGAMGLLIGWRRRRRR